MEEPQMKVLSQQSPKKLKASVSTFLLVLTVMVSIPGVSYGIQSPQEKVDLNVTNRIREEAFKHSQIMETVGYLTNVIGPRLTGSPNLKKAEEYAANRLREWGMANVHLEPWGPFGRGWSLEDFTAKMLTPGFSSLIAYPKAWSSSTNGTVRSEVVFLDAKTLKDLDKYKGELKGKIVMMSPARAVAPNFQLEGRRATDEELLKLENAKPPNDSEQFVMSPEQRASAELTFSKWPGLFGRCGSSARARARRCWNRLRYVSRDSSRD